jgi:hypothetical protein
MGASAIFDDAAVFNAIAIWSGNWPWDQFIMNHLDGYNTDPSVEDVAFTYDTIFSGWTTRQNRVSQVEAVWNDLGSLTSAANLIFEMPDSLKDKYPFKPRIILFGHTHEAAFQYHSGDVDTIRQHGWIDSTHDWVEIRITSGNSEQAFEVSLWSEKKRPGKKARYGNHAGENCKTWSCLCMVLVKKVNIFIVNKPAPIYGLNPCQSNCIFLTSIYF